MSLVRVLSALGVCVCVIGCGKSPTAPSATPPATTFVSFSSEPGDWVGQGQSARYALADGIWFARYDADGSSGRITIGMRDGTFSLLLGSPSGERLGVGTYARAARFSDFGQAMLDFGAFRRGCNEASGQFVIHTMRLGPDDSLDRLHATFEQRCAGSTGMLRGEVSIVANPWQ